MRRLPGRTAELVRAWLSRHGAFVLALVVLLGLGFGASLRQHVARSAEPLVFNDDARQQIFPFFPYHEAGLFPDDYAAAYYRACLPLGYRALYTIGALFADPATISKVVPYVLLAVVVVSVAIAARRLAGFFGALLATSLVLSSDLFLGRMAGGLPRAFAFPLLAAAAAALVCGRARILAAIVCVGAAFYPAGAMPAGIALALVLFVLPRRHRGDAVSWHFGRRARVVLGAGVVSALILMPTLLAARGYGTTLRPADVTMYPEIGPGGRYGPGDRAPFASFPDSAVEQVRAVLKPAGQAWAPTVQEWAKRGGGRGAASNGDTVLAILGGVLLLGGLLLAVRDPGGRRLLALGAAAWLGHLVARPVAPYFYLPQRYAAYPVPILFVVLLPAAAAAIGGVFSRRRAASVPAVIAVVALAAVVVLPFGGRGSATSGLGIDAQPQRRLFDFLHTLPKDALIAGWPSDLDSVPYVSRRQAFVTYELHQAFHQGYADEMRRRMRALVDAYFASDPAPLLRLRDEFKVTHLVFQQSRLSRPPSYFKPFDTWTRKAFGPGAAKGFELPRRVNEAKVFADGPYIVLDLRKLHGP